MKEELKDIFKNVNDWLKYAEAKNGAILALTSAIIFGFLKLAQENCSEYWRLYSYCMVVFGVIILFMAFSSFLPILSQYYKKSISGTGKSDNVYFFMDIKDYRDAINKQDHVAYLKLLYEKAGVKYKKNELEQDIAKQIIVNSQIAYRKFIIFKHIIHIYIGSVLASFIIPVIIILIK